MNQVEKELPKFGKIREIIWPIHGFEMKKFLPMFLMFGFITFNYSILRLMKDTLVVNASAAGSAVLPYLKLWCTTPAAVLFMAVYIKLATVLDRKKLFYAAMLPFLAFFALFPTILYPNIDILHPSASADWISGFLPQGLQGLVEVYRNWTFSLFYVLSELWGSVVMATLFWGMANEITKVKEAKRFYGFLFVGANIPLLVIGDTVKFFNGLGNWGTTLNALMATTLTTSLIIIGLYWYINNVVMLDPKFAIQEKKKKKSKVKMGFVDSLKILGESKYLAYLAAMVLAYGVSINLVEVSWKQYLKDLFQGDNKAYLEFTSTWMSRTGLLTIILVTLGTSNILRIFGWGVTALITPVVLIGASSAFFGIVIFQDALTAIIATLSMTPLYAVCWIGGFHNSFGKASKYAFFDTTKEIAYIPLDDHTKRTGKAAIDGVGGRLGKSGGALVNMILIGILGSVDAITSYVGVATIAIIFVWIFAAKGLNKLFLHLTEGKQDEKVA